MERFTASIEQSLRTNNWYGALILSLTLPDICGKLETPSDGGRSRYINWFNNWVAPKYTYDLHRERRVFLSGNDCYSLRCSYLHEGSDDISTQNARQTLDAFHFITPPPTGIVHCNLSGKNTLQLQIDIFCNDMVNSVASWSISMQDNQEVQERMNGLLHIHDSSESIRF